MRNLLCFTIAILLGSTSFADNIANNSEPTLKVTGFPKGTVVVQLENVPNYPAGRTPDSFKEAAAGGFKKATLLTNGLLIVETEKYTREEKLATRNLNELQQAASDLYATPLNFRRDESGYIKPATRGILAVANYDWRTKQWSEDARVIWTEDGCDYDATIEPREDYERVLTEILRVRLEAIAFEIVKRNSN